VLHYIRQRTRLKRQILRKSIPLLYLRRVRSKGGRERVGQLRGNFGISPGKRRGNRAGKPVIGDY